MRSILAKRSLTYVNRRLLAGMDILILHAASLCFAAMKNLTSAAWASCVRVLRQDGG